MVFFKRLTNNFCHWNAFKPSLIFVGEDGGVGSCLTRLDWKVEHLASLFCLSVDDDEKRFIASAIRTSAIRTSARGSTFRAQSRSSAGKRKVTTTEQKVQMSNPPNE